MTEDGEKKVPLKMSMKRGDKGIIEKMDLEVEEMKCYHGMLLEEEIKGILPQQGDFIIRTKLKKFGPKRPIVTVNFNDELVNLNVKKLILNGVLSFSFDGAAVGSTSMKELIKHYQMGMFTFFHKGAKVMFLNPIAKQAWELRGDSVELVKKLGEGAFGEVHSGKLKLKMGRFMNVAIKVIKKTANNEAATAELQKEGSLMRKFNHPNVVRTFGMVIEKDSIMVVMELVNGGGLNDYVNKNKVSVEEKGSFALDIANGLAYIHSLNCIHRDIACRNCLIDVGKKQAKVSDFGLTRQTESYKIQPNDRIPIRWLAPEVLKSFEYNRAADIYAFGILVWEIFANGAIPYDTMNNAQIKEGVQKDEFRPRFPADTPTDVIETIGMCWIGDPKKRIQLDQVKNYLSRYKKMGSENETETQGAPNPEEPIETIGVKEGSGEKRGATIEKKKDSAEKKNQSGEKKIQSGEKKGVEPVKKIGVSNKRKSRRRVGLSKEGSKETISEVVVSNKKRVAKRRGKSKSRSQSEDDTGR